jgi:hypothetical protein
MGSDAHDAVAEKAASDEEDFGEQQESHRSDEAEEEKLAWRLSRASGTLSFPSDLRRLDIDVDFLTGSPSLDPYREVTAVHFHVARQITSLAFLIAWPQLTQLHLELHGDLEHDLSPLTALKRLQVLKIDRSFHREVPLYNVARLKELPCLSQLEIIGQTVDPKDPKVQWPPRRVPQYENINKCIQQGDTTLYLVQRTEQTEHVLDEMSDVDNFLIVRTRVAPDAYVHTMVYHVFEGNNTNSLVTRVLSAKRCQALLGGRFPAPSDLWSTFAD